MTTGLVTAGNLGADFDLGVQVPNKLGIVKATNAVYGKMRFATSAEATARAAGVVLDASQVVDNVNAQDVAGSKNFTDIATLKDALLAFSGTGNTTVSLATTLTQGGTYAFVYGIVPGTTGAIATANSARIRQALADGVKKLIFGPGTYPFDLSGGPIAIGAVPFCMVGAGMYATTLTSNSSTSDFFTFTGSGGIAVSDMMVAIASGVTPTAGRAFYLHNTNVAIFNNVQTNGFFAHIDVEDSQNTTINNCLMEVSVAGGVFLYAHGTGNGGNLLIDNLSIDGGTGAQPNAGIRIGIWDGVFAHRSQVNRAGVALEFLPPSTGTFSHFFGAMLSLDTSSYGIAFRNSGGIIRRVWMDGCWCGTNDNTGIYAETGAQVDGLRLVNHKLVNNGSSGIYFVGGGVNNLSMIGGNISGNYRGGTSAPYGAVLYGPGTYVSHSFVGVKIGSSDGFANTQPFAFELVDPNVNNTLINNLVIATCDLTLNATAAVGPNFKSSFAAGQMSGHAIRLNPGLKTEAGGTATIASGATSVQVTHGLDLTPAAQDIMVTATTSLSGGGNLFSGSITATSFNVMTDAAPTANVGFAWQARVS